VSEQAAARATTLVPRGTVLFVVRGMSLAREFRVGITMQPSTFNQDVKALVPAPDVDGRYLARCLRWMEPRILRSTGSSTHGTRRLPSGIFEDLPIPLPSLREQQSIAELLDRADAIRRKRQDAIALSHQLLRSAFLEMFGDPASNPRRWEVRRLSTLVAPGDPIRYGVVQPGADVPGGVPLVRVGDLDGMSVDVHHLKRIHPDIEAAYTRSRLHGDEVLIACVGTLGKVALADDRLRGANIARAVARVRPGADVERSYLACFLETPFAQRHFSAEARTVAQPTLNIQQIEQTPVLVPPRARQDAFARLRCQVVDLQRRHEQARVRAERLFDSLVAQALAGRLTGGR
jgi:type I restriction enzyme S subunit